MNYDTVLSLLAGLQMASGMPSEAVFRRDTDPTPPTADTGSMLPLYIPIIFVILFCMSLWCCKSKIPVRSSEYQRWLDDPRRDPEQTYARYLMAQERRRTNGTGNRDIELVSLRRFSARPSTETLPGYEVGVPPPVYMHRRSEDEGCLGGPVDSLDPLRRYYPHA